jgi:hypothetical protein
MSLRENFLKLSTLITFLLSLNSCLGDGIEYLKKKANECHTLEDIYYYPSKLYTPEFFAETQYCPYTLNPLPRKLPTLYIKRKYYDDYTHEYTDYGLEFPYPRRLGNEGVFQARR